MATTTITTATTLRALFLNCTLKAGPRSSNTQSLIDKVAGLMEPLGVAVETVRVLDYRVAFGTAVYEGGDDQWPLILDKIRASDILVVASPVWLGDVSSVAKLVHERLDAMTYELDGRNQHEMYGKVGGALSVGEGDGGQNVVRTILYNLTIAGFSVPPNADCFWTNEAGPGGPYLEADGDTHYFTNERARFMAHNLVHLARALKDHPYPTDLAALQRDAQKVSRPQPPMPARD